VAGAATSVQALQGVQSIEVTDKGIVVIHDPAVVTAEAIADAFALRGLSVRP